MANSVVTEICIVCCDPIRPISPISPTGPEEPIIEPDEIEILFD